MIQVLEWELIFCIEIINYYFAYRICTKQKINIKLMTGAGVFFGAISVILNIQLVPLKSYYILCSLVAISTLFLSGYQETISNRIWQFLIIYMSVTSFDTLISKLPLKIYRNNMLSIEARTILWDCTSLVCIVVFALFRLKVKRYSCNRRFHRTKLHVKSAVLLADFFLCMCATKLIAISDDDGRAKIFAVLAYLVIVYLGTQTINILELNNLINNIVEQERYANEIQREYYQTLLNNENETRSYRHDMMDHFAVIESYLKNQKYSEAEEYIRTLYKELEDIANKKYMVGNDVIDAISGHYLPLIEDYVDICINGKISDELDISSMDLCTIYSNLLKNAIDELQSFNTGFDGKLKLEINFIKGDRFLRLEVRNTSKSNALFNGITTPTSKADTINHGIGLSNILKALGDDNELISINQSDGWVCADVVIPIK